MTTGIRPFIDTVAIDMADPKDTFALARTIKGNQQFQHVGVVVLLPNTSTWKNWISDATQIGTYSHMQTNILI